MTGLAARCSACGADRVPDAAFCEACGMDFATSSPPPEGAITEVLPRQTHAPAVTAAAGEESPLDVGWTGPVIGGVAVEVDHPDEPTCTACGEGSYVDGYCDQCGAKQPDPRSHFTEEPAPWVAGVCDIGKRHTRNEDAMALLASAEQLGTATIVVCDGVSNTTDSHIASLAAARAARDTLSGAIPRGMGTREALVAAISQRLGEAVSSARGAVVAATPAGDAPTPPSCTFVAAVIDGTLAVVGNVGDSRGYWLPDAPTSTPVQLSHDDSFAAEQIREGVPRKEAETGPQAHAITRWLGVDSPDDLTPHTMAVDLTEPGWLLVCTDGLWNYCSEPTELRDLVTRTTASLGEHGRTPLAVATALTDFANASGGIDNITVALARVGSLTADSLPVSDPAQAEAPAPAPAQAEASVPAQAEAPVPAALSPAPPPASPDQPVNS